MFIVINNTGNIVSFLLPNVMVKKGKEVPNYKKMKMVENYLIAEAGIALVSCVLSLIVYTKPEYAIESQALINDKLEGKSRGFLEEVKYIAKRKIILLYIIIQMIGFGLIVALASVITDIIVTFGYKEVKKK